MMAAAVGVEYDVVIDASRDLIAGSELELIATCGAFDTLQFVAAEGGKSSRPHRMSGLSVMIELTAGTTASIREEQFAAPGAHTESALRLQIIDSDRSSRMRMSGGAGVVSMVTVLPQTAWVESELSPTGIEASSSGVRMPMHAASEAKDTRRLDRKWVVEVNIGWPCGRRADIITYPRGCQREESMVVASEQGETNPPQP